MIRSTGDNLANNLGSGAAVAPLAAPVFAIIFFLIFSDRPSKMMIQDIVLLGALSGLVSYTAMYLVVVPVLLLTRRKFNWTAFRLVLLSALITLGPILANMIYGYANAVASGWNRPLMQYVSSFKWDVIFLYFGCGLAVSLIFVIIQISNQQFDIE